MHWIIDLEQILLKYRFRFVWNLSAITSIFRTTIIFIIINRQQAVPTGSVGIFVAYIRTKFRRPSFSDSGGITINMKIKYRFPAAAVCFAFYKKMLQQCVVFFGDPLSYNIQVAHVASSSKDIPLLSYLL